MGKPKEAIRALSQQAKFFRRAGDILPLIVVKEPLIIKRDMETPTKQRRGAKGRSAWITQNRVLIWDKGHYRWYPPYEGIPERIWTTEEETSEAPK